MTMIMTRTGRLTAQELNWLLRCADYSQPLPSAGDPRTEAVCRSLGAADLPSALALLHRRQLI